jgi:hypothetical protein
MFYSGSDELVVIQLTVDEYFCDGPRADTRVGMERSEPTVDGATGNAS